MKEEMIKRVEKLWSEGKISNEIKEKLLKEIESLEEEKIQEKLKKDFNEIEINLIFEDLYIVGKDNINDVIFEKGREGVEVEKINETLLIKSKKKGGISIDIFGFKIGDGSIVDTLKIIIPSKIDLVINSVSGNVYVDNIKGDIKVKTVSGDIEIENTNGKIYCYTLSGDFKGENIKDEFEIISKSGDIKIEKIEKEGNIKTYSGDILIRKGAFKKVFLSTFSGDYKLEEINVENSMELKTMSGDVDIDLLTKDVKIVIETKSGEGEINYEGKITYINRGEISFGDGSKNIFVKTISGDVNIKIL